MIDGPTAIDPLVAEGPRAPVETLRPGLNLQRVLLIEPTELLMADLASGDVRRYESGPPVSVPMVSDRFDLGSAGRLQIQLSRDPRPSSIAHSLVAIDLFSADAAVDVRLQPSNTLEIVGSGNASPKKISVPGGASPAFVVVIEALAGTVAVSARNAETLDSTTLTVDAADVSDTQVTVGGPSVASGSARGRRRSVPVLIDVQRPPAPVDPLTHAGATLRRLVGAVRRRMR